MSRSSKADADKHRQEIIAAASRLFRARGLDGVSIPDLMAEADMTHGGFYRHFASKDALGALGCAAALDELAKVLTSIVARHPGEPAAARAAFIDTYLSRAHRDKPATGCPVAALCGDVARGDPDSAVRATYVGGMRRLADRLSSLAPSGETNRARREQGLATLATLVGALVLSRAAKGEAISDAILAAAKKSLASS